MRVIGNDDDDDVVMTLYVVDYLLTELLGDQLLMAIVAIVETVNGFCGFEHRGIEGALAAWYALSPERVRLQVTNALVLVRPLAMTRS